jgi:cephalosporin-C deacetylase
MSPFAATEVSRSKPGCCYPAIGRTIAVRWKARALFSVALRDLICPPSTVLAAHNHFAGPRHIKVYEFNEHEGGGSVQAVEKVRNLTFLWG